MLWVGDRAYRFDVGTDRGKGKRDIDANVPTGTTYHYTIFAIPFSVDGGIGFTEELGLVKNIKLWPKTVLLERVEDLVFQCYVEDCFHCPL